MSQASGPVKLQLVLEKVSRNGCFSGKGQDPGAHQSQSGSLVTFDNEGAVSYKIRNFGWALSEQALPSSPDPSFTWGNSIPQSNSFYQLFASLPP